MPYWEVADAFLQENSLFKHHLDSYNSFVSTRIHKIVEEFKEVETGKEGCTLKIHKARLEKPVAVEADGSRKVITPMEARLRNKSYSAPLFLEVSLEEDGVEKDRDEVYAGDIPIMVKSSMCHLSGMTREELVKAAEDADDRGGYFIINGSEKVLMTMEDLSPNRIMVSREKGARPSILATIFSVSDGLRMKTVVERTWDGFIYLNYPTFPKNLPLFIVIKALGLEDDEAIIKAFPERPEIKNEILLSLEDTEVKTSAEAMDYLGKRIAAGQSEQYRKQRAALSLDSYLLPHVGKTPAERLRKAYLLANMAERCMGVAAGKREEDDKDHYANKRLKVSGALMEELFRHALGFFVKDVKYQVERAYARSRKLQVRTLIRPDALTDRIRFAMATGVWLGGRTGVSQLLDRQSFLSSLSHRRRVNSPLSKTQPHFEARDLHPTHLFKICPGETPEGQNCGLVKNMAMGCIISNGETVSLENTLKQLGADLIQSK